ncbi:MULTISPECIES: GNAT family N-acetyltransferase [unclassified Nostoc]|jgi:predicted GNAT family N-acyltransferase|uniref:GNAT family N-acetyltransferase n=1 Tax=unclassified Nostoc TaxID=2593658 RepID=UPI000DEC061E|nr:MULTISPECIES: GNAT family N-acetyltransferase [unclassified Nostoc]QHG17101.1 GNAT family N-acetyltransferase [Nostoc sp. ATCC 53789]QLE49865.1 GNAT family N-acetyltransferase [Nostoc sp. C057]RCJ15557.1 acetyltransferase [Nostoc sp. ATCC 53789]
MSNLSIKIAEMSKDFPTIKAIRQVVFQDEQNVDPALEFDGKDAISEHLIAYLNEKAVGTARIRYLEDKTAKIERLAVLSTARGQGIGTKIMEKALQIIANKNITQVVIHAQEYVINLYKKLDFIEEGEIFEEASIRHVTMRKNIS